MKRRPESVSGTASPTQIPPRPGSALLGSGAIGTLFKNLQRRVQQFADLAPKCARRGLFVALLPLAQVVGMHVQVMGLLDLKAGRRSRYVSKHGGFLLMVPGRKSPDSMNFRATSESVRLLTQNGKKQAGNGALAETG